MERVHKFLKTSYAWQQGITGKGITVAILDSGTSGHPDFKERILGFSDFINGRTDYYDDYSHGTHVAGILGGNGGMSAGRYCGMAPECQLLVLKVLDQNGYGSRSHVVNGIQWVLHHQKKYQIRILNISAGAQELEKQKTDELLFWVEEAWRAGIVVVTAAGNQGPAPSSITIPGSSKLVITVGSMDDNCGRDYSGRGPTRECVCKPDLVVPGSHIVSCSSLNGRKSSWYNRKSGTSMSTPIVSGAIALMLQACPEMSNLEVKMKLKECAVDLGKDKNLQGWGTIDMQKLFLLL